MSSAMTCSAQRDKVIRRVVRFVAVNVVDMQAAAPVLTLIVAMLTGVGVALANATRDMTPARAIAMFMRQVTVYGNVIVVAR